MTFSVRITVRITARSAMTRNIKMNMVTMTAIVLFVVGVLGTVGVVGVVVVGDFVVGSC